jgi:hypothetical protein
MITLTFTTLLLIGIFGLLAQMLLGGAHIGHGHGGQVHTGHGHGGQAHGQHHSGHSQGRDFSLLWSLLSPLTFFSLCLGIGATGLLLKPLHLAMGIVVAAALLGGGVFYGLFIRPLMGFVFKFASKPSGALEGTLAREAEALTSFDASGKGLVRLIVDGQIVRIVATLEESDRADALPVLRGEKLTVTSVDGHTNSCHVTRL